MKNNYKYYWVSMSMPIWTWSLLVLNLLIICLDHCQYEHHYCCPKLKGSNWWSPIEPLTDHFLGRLRIIAQMVSTWLPSGGFKYLPRWASERLSSLRICRIFSQKCIFRMFYLCTLLYKSIVYDRCIHIPDNR